MAAGDDFCDIPELGIGKDDLEALLNVDDDDSGDDGCKALQRYDTGDEGFIERAYEDMRKLDAILQEKFEEQLNLQLRREQQAPNQTRSAQDFLESKVIEGLQPGRLESALDIPADRNLYEPVGQEVQEKPPNVTEPELPQKITEEELERLNEEWALIPFEEDETDDIDEQEEEMDDEEGSSMDVDNKLIGKNHVSFMDYEFKFNNRPPPIDHVKRNAERAGRYYTAEEEERLAKLLNSESECVDDMLDVNEGALAVNYENPFKLLENELKALADIETTLESIRHGRLNIEKTSGLDNEAAQLRYGFVTLERDVEGEQRDQLHVLNAKLADIRVKEEELMDKIMNGEEPVPLQSDETMKAILQKIDSDYALTDKSADSECGMDVIPFVQPEMIAQLLGPEPKAGFYNINGQQSAERHAAWGVWLNQRQKELAEYHEALRKDQQLRDELRDSEPTSIETVQEQFRTLSAEIKVIREEADKFINSHMEEA